MSNLSFEIGGQVTHLRLFFKHATCNGWSNNMIKQGFVYIVTNKNNSVLYTGVTSNLLERVNQHRLGVADSFTKRYKLTKLVYAEIVPSIIEAITREKQIKAGSRKKKILLVESLNPLWKDLIEEGWV